MENGRPYKQVSVRKKGYRSSAPSDEAQNQVLTQRIGTLRSTIKELNARNRVKEQQIQALRDRIKAVERQGRGQRNARESTESKV